jgi:hypothetical protein
MQALARATDDGGASFLVTKRINTAAATNGLKYVGRACSNNPIPSLVFSTRNERIVNMPVDIRLRATADDLRGGQVLWR